MVILLKETSNFYYGALWKPCTETKVFTHRWPAVYMYFYTTQQNVFTLTLRSLSVAINQIYVTNDLNIHMLLIYTFQ
jgi:hypothetical protein